MPMKGQKKRARGKNKVGLGVLHGGKSGSKKRSVAYKDGKRVKYPKIAR